MNRWTRVVSISVVLIVVLISSSSYARIAVQWAWDRNMEQAVVLSDGITLLPENSTVQLIWSPDASLGVMDMADPLNPTGNDILLDTKGSEEGWWIFGVDSYDGGGTYVGGYLFQRVFNVALGSSPGLGTQYGESQYASDPLADADWTPPPEPSLSYLFTSDGSPFVLNGNLAVPEPGTLVFSLLGLGVIAIRRRLVS